MIIKIPSQIIVALALQGAASGFLFPNPKRPAFGALKNAYLESLRGEKANNKNVVPDLANRASAVFVSPPSTPSGASSVASTGTRSMQHTLFNIKPDVPLPVTEKEPPTTPQQPFVAAAASPQPPVDPAATTTQPPITAGPAIIVEEIKPEPEKKETPSPVVEVLPIDESSPFNKSSPFKPPATADTTDSWVSASMGSNRESKSQKSSYEAERRKYESGSFLKNSQENTSFRKTVFDEEEKDEHPVPIVEVLPKDHPYQPDDNRKDYLATKNIELEEQNSRLAFENQRQRYELENFLRGSMSDPLYPRLPTNGEPGFGDDLVEANSRLQEENEHQHQDLQAFQMEMDRMEKLIESVESKAYADTQQLENMNDMLQSENGRQRDELDQYKLQMVGMQNILQSIRDEVQTLENDKKALQTDKDMMQTQLDGAENDSGRKLYEIQSFQAQISNMENMIQSLRDETTLLQNEKERVQTEKASLATKLDTTVDEFYKQQNELDAYKKDRSSMESLVQSIRDESATLQNDKTQLQQQNWQMEHNLQKLSKQLATSGEENDRLESEKKKIEYESNEAYRQLQLQLQNTMGEMTTLKNDKASVEARLQSAETDNERQRYEIENSNRDKKALEGMVRSIQKEADVLKEEKQKMETSILTMQQNLQNLERQLTASNEEVDRLRSEKDTLVSQNNEYYESYQQLQLRFQDVLNDLENCRNDQESMRPPLMMDDGLSGMGGLESFSSRINNRRRNQMERSNRVDDIDGGWWN